MPYIIYCFSEHSAGPEADVSEGVGRGAVPTRSQGLHRGHVQPAGQPAVRFSVRPPGGSPSGLVNDA